MASEAVNRLAQGVSNLGLGGVGGSSPKGLSISPDSGLAIFTSPTNIEELKALLADDTKVKVGGTDIDGVLRGKIMSKSKFLSCIKSETQGFGFCSVIFGWDINDATYVEELGISNAGNGYRDIIAKIDLTSFRRIPYESNLPFFLLTFHSITPQPPCPPLPSCPRSLLTTLISSSPYSPYTGAEYEYFQFNETPDSLHSKGFKGLETLSKGMHGYSLLRISGTERRGEWFEQIWEMAYRFGIELEAHHTETGPGVYETALAYQPALLMADNAVLFKLLVKAIGFKYNVIPTFMAKPHQDQPGCSGHVHISLRDPKTQTNVFSVTEEEFASGGRKDAKYDDLKFVSRECEHFLAGVLEGLEDVMPLLVPTINGYKRLVENVWAPVNVSWAYENRLASVRIISPPLGSREATRLEVRVPGADMNPYLAFSAILGLGLHGIREKLELKSPPVNSENYKSFKRLPKTLKEATDCMAREGSLARQVLGDGFVDHYAGTRYNEWTLYSQAVTDWELKRYMELA